MASMKFSEALTMVRNDARLRRAVQRFYAGVDGAVIADFCFITLTTPPGLDGKKLSKAFRLYSLRMKRAGQFGKYYAMREWNSKGTCEHLHILMQASVDANTMRKHWTHCINKVTGMAIENVWCKVERCYSRDGTCKGLACYLSKYLTKQAVNDKREEGYLKRFGRAFWYSQNWVFKNWLAFTKMLFRIGRAVSVVALRKVFESRSKDWLATVQTANILSQWSEVAKLPWSITLSKELRQLGIVYGGF